MGLFNRKSRLEQVWDSINDAVDAPNAMRTALAGSGAGRAAKAAMPGKDRAVKAGLIVGGLAGLTAGSAGISSLRRRQEGARDGS